MDEPLTVKIVTPQGMFGAYDGERPIETAMRIIGVAFGAPDEWSSKYGTNFENDVFAMRTFYWGDCDCGWSNAEDAWCEANPYPYPSPEHDAAWAEFLKDHSGHKPTCSLELPNFLYKPTGFEMRWYKYIGRDTETKGELPADFMERIFATHPRGMSVADATAEWARREDKNAERFAAMMAELPIKPAR